MATRPDPNYAPLTCRTSSASTSRSASSRALAVVVVGALLGLGSLLRPVGRSRRSTSTTSSGVDPVGTGWSQSQVRYYIFALLFVMFDVEAVFIFPWATRLEAYGGFGLDRDGRSSSSSSPSASLYAWRKRVLDG